MTQQPNDLDFAVRLFYEKSELSGKDIGELFKTTSKSAIQRLKRMAREEMAKEPDLIPWCAQCVLTKAAYRAWGMDIEDLERRRAKLIKIKAGRS